MEACLPSVRSCLVDLAITSVAFFFLMKGTSLCKSWSLCRRSRGVMAVPALCCELHPWRNCPQANIDSGKGCAATHRASIITSDDDHFAPKSDWRSFSQHSASFLMCPDAVRDTRSIPATVDSIVALSATLSGSRDKSARGNARYRRPSATSSTTIIA